MGQALYPPDLTLIYPPRGGGTSRRRGFFISAPAAGLVAFSIFSQPG
jgi:hypothetical protein